MQTHIPVSLLSGTVDVPVLHEQGLYQTKSTPFERLHAVVLKAPDMRMLGVQ